MADKQKKVTKPILLIIFGIFAFAVLIGSLCVKDRDFSNLENRTLEFFHYPSVDTVWSGEWMETFETYNLDQIMGRDLLVTANSRLLRGLGRREINGITVCDGDVLLKDTNYSQVVKDFSGDFAQFMRANIRKAVGAANSYGGQVYYVNLYERNVYFYDKYPYHKNECREDFDIANKARVKALSEEGAIVVDTYETFKEHEDEYLYFNTDHHFTMKGAYYTYQELLKKINENNPNRPALTYPKWDEMEIVRPNRKFWGSITTLLGDAKYGTNDFLEYALPSDFPWNGYERLEDGKPSDMPLMRDSEVEEYGWFMNGDYGNTVIKTHREELPNVLIIGYSMTDAIELMAVYNFNEMHSIDPRMFEGSIAEYIANAKCDYVIIVDQLEHEI